MPARAAARSGAARRSIKRKGSVAGEAPARLGPSAESAEVEEWVEADEDGERLQEGEMEILLTGHAATHGIEGEDNWLIETEEAIRGER